MRDAILSVSRIIFVFHDKEMDVSACESNFSVAIRTLKLQVLFEFLIYFIRLKLEIYLVSNLRNVKFIFVILRFWFLMRLIFPNKKMGSN